MELHDRIVRDRNAQEKCPTGFELRAREMAHKRMTCNLIFSTRERNGTSTEEIFSARKMAVNRSEQVGSY